MTGVSELPYLGIRYQIKYHTCNLDCPYCIAQWKKFRADDFDLDTFTRVLEKIRLLPYRVSLRIGVGGEIFTSQPILDEIRKLCNEDNNIIGVSFSTNLAASWDKKIFPFIESVDVSKLGLGCTLHDTVIKSVDQFFEKMEKLHKYGVALYAGYVAIPERIDEIRSYKERCDQIGVPLTMNGIHGRVSGVAGVDDTLIYPAAYTDEQREALKAVWDTPHNYMMEIGGASPKGMACSAGNNYVYIDQKGNVSSCGQLLDSEDAALGNIVTDEITLKNADIICPKNACPCGNENQALKIIDKYYDRGHVLRVYRPKDGYDNDYLYSLYNKNVFNVSVE
ncbi:MAG: radical SAM protein [Gammaproteobacteria bacterium]|nr:radical SAM protein [Gammaproteobacteria bacterium]